MGFYDGKHCVITGGAGMIGRELCLALLAAGARVTVIDDLSRGQNEVSGTELLCMNAAIPANLSYLCKRSYPSVFAIFNLAAKVAGVKYNSQHHHDMFQANIPLQTVPVRVAGELGVPHFLQVSSVCVYSPDHNHPAVERNGTVDSPHPANLGYSWAKRMGEQAVWWDKSLPHAVIVRPSNVFGLYDYFDEKAHVIPSLIKKVLAPGDTITMQSPPDTSREFIFARDAALGMMAALEHGEHKGVYNLGTHGETCVTLQELLATIMALAGVDKRVEWVGGIESGDPARWSDCTKIHKLGWTHQTSLVDGLREVIEWYKTTIQ